MDLPSIEDVENLIECLQKQPSERTISDFESIEESLRVFLPFKGSDKGTFYDLIPFLNLEQLSKGEELGRKSGKLKRKISLTRDSNRTHSNSDKRSGNDYYLILRGVLNDKSTENLQRGTLFELDKDGVKKWGFVNKNAKHLASPPIASTDCTLARFTYLPESIKGSPHVYRRNVQLPTTDVTELPEETIPQHRYINSKMNKKYIANSKSYDSLTHKANSKGLSSSCELEKLKISECVIVDISNDELKRKPKNGTITNGANHDSTRQTSDTSSTLYPSSCSEQSDNRNSQGSLGSTSTASSIEYNLNVDEKQPKNSFSDYKISLNLSDPHAYDFICDVVRKPRQERAQDEIENMSELLKQAPAFTSYNAEVRKKMCLQMNCKTVPNPGTVIMKQGEIVESWYVILKGCVEVFKDNGKSPFKLQMGSSFGLGAKMTALPYNGNMLTVDKDCVFGYLLLEEMKSILEDNQQKRITIYDDDKAISVHEFRDLPGKEPGYFILQATPDQLLDHLMEQTVDQRYCHDFLLTYRAFLPQASGLTYRIERWFRMSKYRMAAVQLLLIWLRFHYVDFENNVELQNFLTRFIISLKSMGGEMSGYAESIRELRATKASSRLIKLPPLYELTAPISIGGGIEHGFPILITKVAKARMTNVLLLPGDKILSINGESALDKSSLWANKMLFSGTEIEFEVKYSKKDYNEFLALPRDSSLVSVVGYTTPPKVSPKLTSNGINTPTTIRRHSYGSTNKIDLDSSQSSSSTKEQSSKNSNSGKKIDILLKRRESLPKSFARIRLRYHNSNNTTNIENPRGRSETSTPNSMVIMETPSPTGRRSSLSDNCMISPSRRDKLAEILSVRNPSSFQPPRANIGIALLEKILKVYTIDHNCRYVQVTELNTAQEIIDKALKEFYSDNNTSNHNSSGLFANNFHLCCVAVDANGYAKTSNMAQTTRSIPSSFVPGTRLYLKPNNKVGSICSLELADEMFREETELFHITNFDPLLVAREITRRDSAKFCSIDSTEYISKLLNCYSPNKLKNLEEYIVLSNNERWWVCSEVVKEHNFTLRVKTIKQFLKIAEHCRKLNSINAMFSIISGLDHASVSQLKATWDKVPNKYKKLQNDLRNYMNPFHNHGEYRKLVKNAFEAGEPCVPFFPILQKDLIMVEQNTPAMENGLINFDKLRSLADLIQSFVALCPFPYSTIDHDRFESSQCSNGGDSFQTSTQANPLSPNISPGKLNKKKINSSSSTPTLKSSYELQLMKQAVRTYVANIDNKSTTDEVQLDVLSKLCEYIKHHKRASSLNRINSFAHRTSYQTQPSCPRVASKQLLTGTRSSELLAKNNIIIDDNSNNSDS